MSKITKILDIISRIVYLVCLNGTELITILQNGTELMIIIRNELITFKIQCYDFRKEFPYENPTTNKADYL